MASVKINLGAGPALFPDSVRNELASAISVYKDTGLSILELNHRSDEFLVIYRRVQERLLELLGLHPSSYQVLIFGGGARTLFGLIPLNFLIQDRVAGYVLTGYWSESAMKEAAVCGKVMVCASGKVSGRYVRIPKVSEYRIPEHPAYIHLTSNSTVEGIQFQEFPRFGDCGVIADVSSDILSLARSYNEFDMIYAAAQKNLGISGTSIAAIKKVFASKCSEKCPESMNFNYLISHEQPNATPPVVGIFIMDLMLDWIVRQGGVSEIEKRNNMKAGMIYDVIDQYEDVYFNSIEKVSRSRMNITWNMKDESVVQRFVQFSEANGFTGIRGHRSLGGIRVSLYNTVSVEQTRRFADLMIEFARK